MMTDRGKAGLKYILKFDSADNTTIRLPVDQGMTTTDSSAQHDGTITDRFVIPRVILLFLNAELVLVCKE